MRYEEINPPEKKVEEKKASKKETPKDTKKSEKQYGRRNCKQ